MRKWINDLTESRMEEDADAGFSTEVVDAKQYDWVLREKQAQYDLLLEDVHELTEKVGEQHKRIKELEDGLRELVPEPDKLTADDYKRYNQLLKGTDDETTD